MEIFERLSIPENAYFFTGSRALDTDSFKISSESSDYDYVLMINYRHIVIQHLIENNINIDYSCYNGGFKFQYENKTYNIITTVKTEFLAWREALSILKLLISLEPCYQKALSDKLSRYCLYEQFRGLIKTAIKLGE
jgi:hypothetical protein